MRRTPLTAWLPIVILPAAAIAFTPADWDRWAFMWLLAGMIYAGCKWLTWRTAAIETGGGTRPIGYLLAWPGLDAAAFLAGESRSTPTIGRWIFALAKTAFGFALIAVVYPRMSDQPMLLRGWVGMIGIVFVLHFGLFHLLQLIWSTLGVDARPLMDWPILAASVSDFWGKRWNSAFRDLTHRFLFRPLTQQFGPKAALALGFLFSGIVHDLVISLPARGGYGGPTLFFLLQAAAIFVERSALGRRIGLGRGVLGWAFTMLVLVGPVMLLFHPPFVNGVVVPFLDWITQAL